MKERDALVDLRAWRDEFARLHGYDLGAMVAALRVLDQKAGTRVVRGTPRRPTPTRADSLTEPVLNKPIQQASL